MLRSVSAGCLLLAALVPAASPPAAAANTAPVCADVTASVENYDNPDDLLPPPSVTIAAACSDPDPGTTLRYAVTSSTSPAHGNPAYHPAGFTYSPNVGFYGTDSFDYVALDGTDVSNAATVTITVLRPVPDDRDHDGVPTKNDPCPDVAGSDGEGCPDSDGDGLADNEDQCPADAATGRDDGCPPVVGERAWAREARRQARRLGRRWHVPAVRARAWRTSRISIRVHVPASAATGRQLRVGPRSSRYGDPATGRFRR